jgi:hypothetical protein
MPFDLPLSCRCGHVRGTAREVAPSAGFRLVCYCRDCQAFAHFLMPTGRLQLTAGMEAVRCLRLSSKGIFRWYADCCRTPIGNTAGPRFPVVGLIHSFMRDEAGGRSRDEVLGPPVCRIYERSAVGPLPPDAPAPPSLGVFFRRGSTIFGWWWHGLGRPNPFFDAATKAPLSAPRVLTPGERAAL